MKKILTLTIVLWVCSFMNLRAQSNFITFPTNGAIFQQNTSGNHPVVIAGQMTNGRTYYYRIETIGGSNIATDKEIKNTSNIKVIDMENADRKVFYITESNLAKGYYKIRIYYKKCFLGICDRRYKFGNSVEFGVGDNYYVAGQSNASGYGLEWNDDNAASTTGKTGGADNHVYARFLNINGNEDLVGGLQNINFGLPYSIEGYYLPDPLENEMAKYDQFSNALVQTSDLPCRLDSDYTDNVRLNRKVVFPSGYNTWSWAPLAVKLAKEKSTPTMWFNCAFPGASLGIEGYVTNTNLNVIANSWKSDPANRATLSGRFNSVLKLNGSIFGAKAVLWQQGETDHMAYLTGHNSDYMNNYKSELAALIQRSRTAVAGTNSSLGSKLAWYIAKTSYLPFKTTGLVSGNQSTQSTLTKNNPSCSSGYSGSNTSSDAKWVSSNLTSVQDNSQYLNSPFHLSNIFQGPNSDDLSGNQYRSSKSLLHFSGVNGLETLANQWYTAINAPDYAESVSPTVPGKYISVKKIGDSFELYVEPKSGSSVKYYWVRDSQHPEDGFETLINSHTFNNPRPGAFLYCYALVDGRYYIYPPVIVPGSTFDDNSLEIVKETQGDIPQSGGASTIIVNYSNIDWVVGSYPSWLTPTIVEENSQVIFTAVANTGSARTGIIEIKEDVTGGLIRSVSITQSGTGTTGSTSLTTLSPTNDGSEWGQFGAYRFDNKNISNNTMQVSGVQYSQGIGVHANSRVVYNLGGAYTTFTGLVGRDDQADNEYDSGKVVFSIKTDGATVWTSSVHGNTSGAESFSIPVSGKSTLELLVSESFDGVSYDHANWMNVYLSGGGGGGCTSAAPTGVTATAVPYGGGNTTLSASCEAGKTVQWSGSVGSGSPKTVYVSATSSYTAKCVSAGCGDSPQVGVTVTVPTSPPATGCSAITNDLVMGTWTVTGHQLVAKQFHGQWWLVQRINTSPETFLVRGAEMLTRGDVTLSNGSYSGLVSCFAFTYSDYGGLEPPNSTVFPTPSGYSLAYESGGAPYYTASGTPPVGCTNAYLTNSWTYASAAGSTGTIPNIGKSIDNNDMTMGSVNYSSSYPGSGIGTHATSEIIYDLGGSHSYQYFKATAGKDNESVCGENRLVFKVINNANGAVLVTSPTVGNPAYSLPQTTDISVPISGVRYLKLVVEDGGDGIYCDHANWARARLACTSSARVSAKDSLAPLFTIYPNVNNGEFTVEVDLDSAGDFRVDLINSSGAVYKQENHTGKRGQNPVQFKAGNVQSGLYLLRVSTKDRLETKTVVIEK